MIIIIPAYEPDQRMITLLRSIQDKWMCTVIVVDDGSPAVICQEKSN